MHNQSLFTRPLKNAIQIWEFLRRCLLVLILISYKRKKPQESLVKLSPIYSQLVRFISRLSSILWQLKLTTIEILSQSCSKSSLEPHHQVTRTLKNTLISTLVATKWSRLICGRSACQKSAGTRPMISFSSIYWRKTWYLLGFTGKPEPLTTPTPMSWRILNQKSRSLVVTRYLCLVTIFHRKW